MQLTKEVKIEIVEPLPIHNNTNAESIIIDNIPNEKEIESERPKKLDEIMKKIKERNLKNI